MTVCIALRDDYDGGELRRLAKRCRDPRQVRRLLALAAAYDGMSRTDAAKVRSTTRRPPTPCHHRGWLPSLEQAHRSTRNHHVHRNERLGPHRSIITAGDISPDDSNRDCPSPRATLRCTMRSGWATAPYNAWLSALRIGHASAGR